MNDASEGSSGWVMTAVMVVAHATAWGGLLGGLLLIVPQYDGMFRRFNMKLSQVTEGSMKLSQVTEGVLTVSRWVGEFLPLAALYLAVLLTVDVVVLVWLRVWRRGRPLSWLWFLLLLLIPVGGFALGGASLWLTERELLRRLGWF